MFFSLCLGSSDTIATTVVVADNFSKLVGLYPAQNTTFKEFDRALLPWVSFFGVPKEIRTDGGSQFTSKLSSDICSLQSYHHLVIVAYHLQANGLAERRNKELLFGAIIAH